MNRALFLLCAAVLAAASVHATPPDAMPGDPWAKKTENGIVMLEWDDLIPPDFDPDKLIADRMAQYGLSELDDADPRAQQLLKEVQEVWSQAPVVEALDGRRVKLPGFVVPLEGDGEKVSEFLLVPYFGACIHSPPPPSNQIIYVRAGAAGGKVRRLFDTVWVVGRLSAEYQANDIGSAGYTLDAERIDPY